MQIFWWKTLTVNENKFFYNEPTPLTYDVLTLKCTFSCWKVAKWWWLIYSVRPHCKDAIHQRTGGRNWAYPRTSGSHNRFPLKNTNEQLGCSYLAKQYLFPQCPPKHWALKIVCCIEVRKNNRNLSRPIMTKRMNLGLTFICWRELQEIKGWEMLSWASSVLLHLTDVCCCLPSFWSQVM